MWKYVLKRIVLMIFTMFIILSLTFILIKCLPPGTPGGLETDQIAFYLRQVNYGYMLDFETPQVGLGELQKSWVDSAGISHYIYVRPVMEQYFSWLGNIFTRWDWGTSTQVAVNQSAMTIIIRRLPTTLLINVFTVIVAVPIGFALGIWAALKKNKVTDGIISTLVVIFISVPSFIIITLLMSLLCYTLGWLPSQWPTPEAPLDQKVLGYIIPVMSLSLGTICAYTRWVRAELCDVMASEFLLLARTKGLTRSQSVVRHALRNAIVPIFPMLIGEIITCLTGSMILERLYNIPGIGDIYVDALGTPGVNTDYNVLMVDMALVTVIGLVAGLLVDLSYGFIDPRIRVGAKK